jgi:hypothetical protein
MPGRNLTYARIDPVRQDGDDDRPEEDGGSERLLGNVCTGEDLHRGFASWLRMVSTEHCVLKRS